MFCKHCGQVITDDSTYCKYCGKIVLEDVIEQNEYEIETASTEQENDTISSETEYISQNTSFNQEISEKGNIYADEIIVNLKMIGWAILCCVIYLVGFYLYHQKDIKRLKLDSEDSYFGESCYDPRELTFTPEMDAWTIYQREIFYKNNPGREYFGFSTGPGNSRKREVVPEEYKNDPIYEAAVEEANKNKQELLNEINFHRTDGFWKDLKKNALWSLLISICFFVIGRYIIIFYRWVQTNKTQY